MAFSNILNIIYFPFLRLYMTISLYSPIKNLSIILKAEENIILYMYHTFRYLIFKLFPFLIIYLKMNIAKQVYLLRYWDTESWERMQMGGRAE